MNVDSAVDEMIKRVNNWGRWGEEDEVGTVNYIRPEKVVAASALVRTGRVFSLAIPLAENGPQPPSERRLNPQHLMLATGADAKIGNQSHDPGGWGYADDMVIMGLQAGTHWDSLAHSFYGSRMYNDRDCALVTAKGAAANSIDRLSGRLVTRAVLLDLPRYHGAPYLQPTHRITTAEIERCLEKERVEVETGDVLLLRTGNLARARSAGSWQQFTYSSEPGLAFEALPWIHDHEIAAIAVDNWACEALPSGTSLFLPVHAVAIVYMGLLIGEIFDLDALAEDCSRDGVYEFLFCGPPLPFLGAVGSPVNPIVVK
jgi:kynurenine formamidase